MIQLAIGAAVAALYVGYWSTPEAHRNLVLTAIGVGGLALYSWPAALAMAGLVIAVWVGLADPAGSRGMAALVAVIAAFSAYKLTSQTGPLDTTLSLVGFVYAVPRAIHLLIDARYRGLARPSFASLNAYFWFFPLLIVGPIHRLSEFERSTRRRRLDLDQVGLGLERILVGLVSVKVLADWAVSARLHNYIEGIDPARDGAIAALRSIEYGLNLYFSFAGWSAVAIGIAATLGFSVAENFQRPFAQPNITLFWRSWHMTLTRFTRDYVFQPIAAQTRRPQLGVLATMLAIALWHEFSLRYVAWAVWHALGLLIHRRFEAAKESGVIPRIVSPTVGRWLGVGLTVIFVFLGFTITRVASLGDAWSEFVSIFSGGYR